MIQQNYVSLRKLREEGVHIDKLPFSIRILLENAIRNHDGFRITDEHVETLKNWNPKGTDKEVPFMPARVLMQDFTGVPSVVDIASLREEAVRKGKNGNKINPAIPVDLVIDHSVQIDFFGTEDAYKKNVAMEYERNSERYQLLKWAQKGLKNFTVVPPGMGICHQVNLEYLAKGVIERDGWVFPDTLVGTDSHTPMVNGIGVLGWGVGGIEAEAAFLGQPTYFACPEVIGLRLTGKMPEGITATDMVLTITDLLRKRGVVGKFVEVFGDGLKNLTVPDRATISNMSPEFGCTATYFPIDDQTLEYMRRTNRSDATIQLVETYCKENLMWHVGDEKIDYTDIVELDLSKLEPTVAGPKRPQDKILAKNLHAKFGELLQSEFKRTYLPLNQRKERATLTRNSTGNGFDYQTLNNEAETASLKSIKIDVDGESYQLSDGYIAIAAITSCTNTSNPSVMVGAGLVARKARALGLNVKPWVKTSLAPGSKVVTQYLTHSGLIEDLDALKYNVVGYGCTSCIGNSGPLPPHIDEAYEKGNIILASVLSGNRNFEARVHPKVKMNFLMSPMLVVAYSLVGRVDVDITTDEIGKDKQGNAVYLKDIWPTQQEINDIILNSLKPEDFKKNYDVIYDGEEQWHHLHAPDTPNFVWDENSTYIREIPFFQNLPEVPEKPKDINAARVLLKLGDSVTTDHISPAGAFSKDSPAGKYLLERGVEQRMFNSYGSRRGNHEVMMRGTFANVRIKNQVATKEGGYTTHFPQGEEMTIFDASMQYQKENMPLIILAGKEYGSGSSRDWAAKGTILLGVKAVIAESYERIHRSNLLCMGVLPLQFLENQNADSLGLKGNEVYSIEGISDGLTPHQRLNVHATKEDGSVISFEVNSRLNSQIEVEYVNNGGILQYVLRDFLKEA